MVWLEYTIMISQEKLARLAIISNNTIINIEAGGQQNQAVGIIKKITRVLNGSTED